MTLKVHTVNSRKSLRSARSLRIASVSVVVATLPLVGAVALPGVVTSAAAEPVVAEQGAAAGSGQISSVSQGTLSWGVKQSFRNYLTGPIAGGHWNLDGIGFTGGAKTEDGAFQFSAAIRNIYSFSYVLLAPMSELRSAVSMSPSAPRS